MEAAGGGGESSCSAPDVICGVCELFAPEQTHLLRTLLGEPHALLMIDHPGPGFPGCSCSAACEPMGIVAALCPTWVGCSWRGAVVSPAAHACPPAGCLFAAGSPQIPALLAVTICRRVALLCCTRREVMLSLLQGQAG